MKHSLFGIMLVALPLFAQNATAQPSAREYYSRIAGNWEASTPDQFEISYSVAADRLTIAGETCAAAEDASSPQRCGFIDQTYLWESADLLREYPEFGLRPVEILELTPDKMVRREANPVLKDHSAVTSEELMNDGTLHIVSETYVNGQTEPRSRREYTLKRVASY